MKKFITNIYHGIFFETSKEGVKKFSIGRLSFVALFTQAMFIWSTVADVPETMLTTLMALLVYVLGTKGMAIAKEILTIRKNTDV